MTFSVGDEKPYKCAGSEWHLQMSGA